MCLFCITFNGLSCERHVYADKCLSPFLKKIFQHVDNLLENNIYNLQKQTKLSRNEFAVKHYGMLQPSLSLLLL